MNKLFIWITVLLLLSCRFSSAQSVGCTDPQANNYDPLAVLNDGSCQYGLTTLNLADKVTLSAPLLNETSGLAFLDGKLWTFCDSGNPNDIYRIDTTTNTVYQTVDVSNATNVDWEDMTANSTHLFIGDFGNNNGNRHDLKIYRISKNDLTSAATSVTAAVINFSFSDQTSFTSLPNNNNFDCEAMIFLNDSIHLFSKNWINFQTKHYVLPNIPGTQVAQYRETLNTGFLVTGATIQQYGVVALIGYVKTGTKPVSMYMLYDYKPPYLFNGNKRIFDLSTMVTYGQVEGIEFTNNGQVHVSNELYTTGASVPAKLRSVQLSPYLPASFLIPPPTADFTANQLDACAGATIQFTDLSTNAPGAWLWSFPGAVPASSNQQHPQVFYSAAGIYPVTLIAINAAGSDTIIRTNYITINEPPVTPGTIAGQTVVCSNTSQVYAVSTVAGAATYTWTVPAGAVITAGQGTPSITIDFLSTAQSGNICVYATGNCGNSSPGCLPVTVTGIKPVRPSVISGSEIQCAGTSGVQYSCQAVPNAAYYQWVVPAQVNIISGQGTNIITVEFLSAFSSGTIKVAAGNCIGISAYRNLSVRAKPVQPGMIIGPVTEVCPGSIGVSYSISPVTGASSYLWIVPANTTITNGQGTTNITIDADATFTSGTIKVSGTNSCGSGASRSLFFRSKPPVPGVISGPNVVCPNQPAITYSVLPVAGASAYQWSIPAGAIIQNGQNTPTLVMNMGSSGGSVKVKAGNACGFSSNRTLSISTLCRTDVEDSEKEGKPVIYPNPAADKVLIQTSGSPLADIRIFDLSGREIMRNSTPDKWQVELTLTGIPYGIYLVETLDVLGRRDVLRLVYQN